HPVDALAASEELGLGDHRTTTPCIAAVTAALLLRLKTSGASDLLRLVARFGLLTRLAHLHNSVGGRPVVIAALLTRPTPRPTTNGTRLIWAVAGSPCRRDHRGKVWSLEQERSRRASRGLLRS